MVQFKGAALWCCCHGENYAIDVDPSETVEQAKQRVLKEIGAPPTNEYVVLIDSTFTENHRPLSHYGVNGGGGTNKALDTNVVAAHCGTLCPPLGCCGCSLYTGVLTWTYLFTLAQLAVCIGAIVGIEVVSSGMAPTRPQPEDEFGPSAAQREEFESQRPDVGPTQEQVETGQRIALVAVLAIALVWNLIELVIGVVGIIAITTYNVGMLRCYGFTQLGLAALAFFYEGSIFTPLHALYVLGLKALYDKMEYGDLVKPGAPPRPPPHERRGGGEDPPPAYQ